MEDGAKPNLETHKKGACKSHNSWRHWKVRRNQEETLWRM